MNPLGFLLISFSNSQTKDNSQFSILNSCELFTSGEQAFWSPELVPEQQEQRSVQVRFPGTDVPVRYATGCLFLDCTVNNGGIYCFILFQASVRD